MNDREKLRRIMADLAAGKKPAESGFSLHMDRATKPSDYDKLNPNSLDTECRDCDAYYEVEWAEGEHPPDVLTCPHCGSHNHGSVGSPAGAYYLALWDPNLP